jgi:predicted 2-oxoglutarate/Fe(II)-dependent dioxygenase YbiX/peroxiredoxin
MPFVPLPASEQGALAPGERLCDLVFRDPQGGAVSLYHHRLFGWPKVIHVAASPGDAEAGLRRLAEHVRAFESVETHVVGVTRASPRENAALAQRLKLPYLLLSDEEGQLHTAAGMEEGAAARTFFFDSLLRLEREISAGENQCQGDAALAHAKARFAANPPAVIGMQAPALVVPNVVDPDHCRRLIALWERSAKLENAVSSASQDARNNSKSKIRSDAYLMLGSPECNELLGVLRRRLLPEVAKAFNFTATRTEHFRVGCYDAAQGGFFAPHRDDTQGITAHRRFALTLNLNSGDYEGGYLRLPEYGPQLYAPAAGGAVVFSCSVLHVVTPVTRGRRFVVVGFLWGEDGQKIFEASHADMFPNGTDLNRIPET